MKIKSIIIMALVVIAATIAKAQGSFPEPYGPQPIIGMPMPDFTLDNITHYKLKKASLNDFKGKWLVIDFWATFCAPCLKNFPKINQLQEQFKDRVQFILLGLYGPYVGTSVAETKNLYENLSQRQKLQLTVAYDSILMLKWGIYGVPNMIFIDPNGVVRATSKGYGLNSENLQALMDGKDPQFEPKDTSITFDRKNLLLVDGNSGSDTSFLFRSVLAKNLGREMILPPEISATKLSGKLSFQATRSSLSRLYNYAYIGQWGWYDLSDSLYATIYPNPILEMKDTSLFKYNFEENTGSYDYSLSVQPGFESKSQLMEMVQRDLKNYFGYDVAIETREMPYWKLVTTSESAKSKLATKGGDGKYPAATTVGFTLKNVPVKMLVSIIYYYYMHFGPQFVDETGINGNIDITVDAYMNDMNDIKKSLQKSGLDLVKGKKMMKVIVIRDPKK